MSPENELMDSVTTWMQRLRKGEPDAAEKLWERYFTQLVRLARATLQGRRCRVGDADDVALSAFASFCRGLQQERFPRLADREDLWKLLFTITANKACDLVTHERRLKRGEGNVRGDSAFLPSGEGEERGSIDEIIGKEPTPAFAAQVAEECRLLLDALDDETLRQIALWKMECFTNQEIANKLGCVDSTVERKLAVIRSIWEKRANAERRGEGLA